MLHAFLNSLPIDATLGFGVCVLNRRYKPGRRSRLHADALARMVLMDFGVLHIQCGCRKPRNSQPTTPILHIVIEHSTHERMQIDTLYILYDKHNGIIGQMPVGGKRDDFQITTTIVAKQ